MDAAEAADCPVTAGVEHVDERVVDRDTGREKAARADDLQEAQSGAAHGEHRDSVASGVDGVQQPTATIECQ